MERKEFLLTARELLYGASQLGATTFFGLADPFFGLDTEDLRREVGIIQEALTAKAYASQGFDDGFQLAQDIRQLIGLCAHCDAYVALECLQAGGGQANYVFYRSGPGAAMLKPQKDGFLLSALAEIPLELALWQTLEGIIMPPAAGDGAAAAADTAAEDAPAAPVASDDIAGTAREVAFPEAALRQAKTVAWANPPKALALLESVGIPPDFAALLLDVFLQRAGYFALSAVRLADHLHRQLIFLCNERLILRLACGAGGAQPFWTAGTTDKEQLRQAVLEICHGVEEVQGE